MKPKADAYTEQRREEIRQLREEIEWMQGAACHGLDRLLLEMQPWWEEEYMVNETDLSNQAESVVYWVRVVCANRRILARLEAALAEKLQGWKEQG